MPELAGVHLSNTDDVSFDRTFVTADDVASVSSQGSQKKARTSENPISGMMLPSEFQEEQLQISAATEMVNDMQSCIIDMRGAHVTMKTVNKHLITISRAEHHQAFVALTNVVINLREALCEMRVEVLNKATLFFQSVEGGIMGCDQRYTPIAHVVDLASEEWIDKLETMVRNKDITVFVSDASNDTTRRMWDAQEHERHRRSGSPVTEDQDWYTGSSASTSRVPTTPRNVSAHAKMLRLWKQLKQHMHLT